LRGKLVVRPSEPFGIALRGTGISNDSTAISIYDDELDGVSTAVASWRGLRHGLICSASLVTETEGIYSDGRGVFVESVHPNQPMHHRLVDVVASAPIRDGFAIPRLAIQDLVDVRYVDHEGRIAVAARPQMLRLAHGSPMQLERGRTRSVRSSADRPHTSRSMAFLQPAILEH